MSIFVDILRQHCCLYLISMLEKCSSWSALLQIPPTWPPFGKYCSSGGRNRHPRCLVMKVVELLPCPKGPDDHDIMMPLLLMLAMIMILTTMIGLTPQLGWDSLSRWLTFATIAKFVEEGRLRSVSTSKSNLHLSFIWHDHHKKNSTEVQPQKVMH